MSSESEQSEEKLAREILSYFLRNPQSADDIEGVARWRLLDEAVHRTVAETSRALKWLVSRGYLQSVSLPGSGQVYSLNRQMLDKAERFMMQDAPPADEEP